MDLLEQIFTLFSDFTNPKKRIFVGYLLLAFFIAFGWLVFIRRTSLSHAKNKILDGKVFFSRSSLADYKIFFINRIWSLFISPLLITQLAIATALYFAFHNQSFVPQGVFGEVHQGIVIGLFSISMFLIDDFTKYLVHRWMHRWPLLWAIHKVHHSAETLTPITVYRVHPLEGVLYALRSAGAQGVAISTFIFLFGSSVDLYTIVGVNILVFIFHVTGSNLRHSHINISYWPWLERILISPAQHQLHHSIAEEHFDKNFGAALAIWDWMFGSLHLSHCDQKLEFGLSKTENASASSLLTIYWQPLCEIATISTRTIRKMANGISTKLARKPLL